MDGKVICTEGCLSHCVSGSNSLLCFLTGFGLKGLKTIRFKIFNNTTCRHVGCRNIGSFSGKSMGPAEVGSLPRAGVGNPKSTTPASLLNRVHS